MELNTVQLADGNQQVDMITEIEFALFCGSSLAIDQLVKPLLQEVFHCQLLHKCLTLTVNRILSYNQTD